MRRRRPAWPAWGILATSLVLAVVSWLLHSKNAAVPLPAVDEPLSQDISALFPIGMLMVFCVPAALIVARQPGNPIGWLLATMGYSTGVSSSPPSTASTRS
jgi:hypothetical protein